LNLDDNEAKADEAEDAAADDIEGDFYIKCK